MADRRFFKCRHCGNFIGMINSSGVPVVCCGEPMSEVIAGSVDASVEKHLPVVTVDGDTVSVSVGSAEHPMAAEHYIMWIYIETENGGQRKVLKPNELPKAVFKLSGDKAVAAYALCNLHGLWKTDIK